MVSKLGGFSLVLLMAFAASCCSTPEVKPENTHIGAVRHFKNLTPPIVVMAENDSAEMVFMDINNRFFVSGNTSAFGRAMSATFNVGDTLPFDLKDMVYTIDKKTEEQQKATKQ